MLAPDGIFTALVTPFQPAGALDLAALRKSVAFQIEHGVRGVVPWVARASRCRSPWTSIAQ